MSSDRYYFHAVDPDVVNEVWDRYTADLKRLGEESQTWVEEQFTTEGVKAQWMSSMTWSSFGYVTLTEEGRAAANEAAGRRSHYPASLTEVPPGWHDYVKGDGIQPYRGGRDKASKEVKATAKTYGIPSPRQSLLDGDFGLQLAPDTGRGFGEFEPHFGLWQFDGEVWLITGHPDNVIDFDPDDPLADGPHWTLDPAGYYEAKALEARTEEV